MYKVDDIVSGKVTGTQKYGIFVKVDQEYSGLIHISEISNSYVKNINDYINSEDIKARVIEVNDQTKHLKLSIKNLDNEFRETKNGFKTLKANLKPWIEEKLKEINNH